MLFALSRFKPSRSASDVIGLRVGKVGDLNVDRLKCREAFAGRPGSPAHNLLTEPASARAGLKGEWDNAIDATGILVHSHPEPAPDHSCSPGARRRRLFPLPDCAMMGHL